MRGPPPSAAPGGRAAVAVGMLNPLRERALGQRWRFGQTPPPVGASAAPTPWHDMQSQAVTELGRPATAALLATGGIGLAMWPWVTSAGSDPNLRQWLWFMLLVTGVRLLHLLRARRGGATEPDFLRPYLAGVGVNALIWTVLPWMAYGGTDPSLRLMLLFAACGAAGVQALSLGAFPTIAIAQSAICLLPNCAWLLGSTDGFNTGAAALTIAPTSPR